jgi:epoxide hydrolase-like predicted phosphatase
VTIRAVFFDFGGVLVRTEFQAPRQHLSERLGLEYDDVVRIVFESETAGQASIGAITEDQHWEAVMRRLHLPLSETAAIRDEFFAGDVIDRELLDGLRDLKKTYKVGLISNAWSGLRPWIVSRKFDDAFDLMVISAEVGVAKPDARIYQYALEQFAVAPGESVFVDDFPVNVDGARQAGMHAILFTAPEPALTQLDKLLALHR